MVGEWRASNQCIAAKFHDGKEAFYSEKTIPSKKPKSSDFRIKPELKE
tara:strand:- start:4953 stop:5096 length:144 start_codon:yes stop_codon:yes gene_type:complete